MKCKSKRNVLQIVSILLTIVLVLNIVLCGSRFYMEFKEDKIETDGFVRTLTNMAYDSLMRQCYALDAQEREADPAVYEFYCISKYFEHASLYKTYLGYDEEKAQAHKEEMDAYAEDITTYTYTIGEINGMFGIT